MDEREPVRCPKCASTDVRYSYTQTKWDLMLDLLFSMDAFRCRSCRARFHKFDSGGPDENDLAMQQAARRGRSDDISQS